MNTIEPYRHVEIQHVVECSSCEQHRRDGEIRREKLANVGIGLVRASAIGPWVAALWYVVVRLFSLPETPVVVFESVAIFLTAVFATMFGVTYAIIGKRMFTEDPK